MSLHWLPVRFRIDFKVLSLIFKCLNGLAPPYLSDLLCEHPERTFRSANQSLLTVPKSKLKSRGDRAFAIAAPKLWNTLPIHIRTAPTLLIFKSKLKTYLFTIACDLWCCLLSDVCLVCIHVFISHVVNWYYSVSTYMNNISII